LNGRFTPNSVEKLCFTTARKFLGIFRLPGARITDQFCGSEVRQAGFSWDFYYPLITSVQNDAQIANEIVALFKSEFFNTIEGKAASQTAEILIFDGQQSDTSGHSPQNKTAPEGAAVVDTFTAGQCS